MTVDARAHGELLAPACRDVLAEAGATAGDLGAVVAGVGPGPFTGLRVGLVTAATLGDALGIPAYGVCSLDGLGAGTGPGRCWSRPTPAAGRSTGRCTTTAGASPTRPCDRPADLDLPTGVLAAVGDGAPALRRRARPAGAARSPRYPTPLALAAAGRRPDPSPAPPGEPLTPLYLRRPDAVEPGARKPAS